MSVRVQTEDFDIGHELHQLTAGRTDIGAFAATDRRLIPEQCGFLR